MKFELVSKYEGQTDLLPTRGTKESAGYDLRCAEDIVIPSIWNQLMEAQVHTLPTTANLEDTKHWLEVTGMKPTLVPTGIRALIDSDKFGGGVARSSLPLKHMLMVANGEAIIDADYSQAKNEGHIHVMLLNFAPFDIQLRRGDKIAQLIFMKYYTVEDEENIDAIRTDGFGHTGN